MTGGALIQKQANHHEEKASFNLSSGSSVSRGNLTAHGPLSKGPSGTKPHFRLAILYYAQLPYILNMYLPWLGRNYDIGRLLVHNVNVYEPPFID